MKTLVTKDSLQLMLDDGDPEYVMHVVGRALVALFRRQTKDEQATSTTRVHNTRGFAYCDAKSGSLTAKAYLKHGRLEEWQVKKWTRIQRNGYPRLCRYARQLNEVANEKASMRGAA